MRKTRPWDDTNKQRQLTINMLLSQLTFLVLLLIRLGSLVNALDLQFRPARTSDLPKIAKLLTETFEDVPYWNVLQRKMAENAYQTQLQNRMAGLVQQGAKHSLIVAVNQGNDEVAAFMELGTMPSPIPVTTFWEGQEIESRPELPYLANLAVSDTCRRQQLGTKLVRLAMKIAEKWTTDAALQVLYLAVDKENLAAVKMYEKLEFVCIIDETERLSDEQIRKLRRKHRLYFQKKLFRGAPAIDAASIDLEGIIPS
jgi:ribosomal protein S18 acetylase RimI-like enzyme